VQESAAYEELQRKKWGIKNSASHQVQECAAYEEYQDEREQTGTAKYQNTAL
jgi:hypothetical protein